MHVITTAFLATVNNVDKRIFQHKANSNFIKQKHILLATQYDSQ